MPRKSRKPKPRPLTAKQKDAVESNIRLVAYTVNKQKQWIASFDDDVQDGAVVLMECAKGFKKSKGYAFGTYVVSSIKNSLLKQKAESGLIRVPAYLNTRRYAKSPRQKDAKAVRSIGSVDAAMESEWHPVSPEDEESEFGYRAMRAVRWAIRKLTPIERRVVREMVFRGRSVFMLSPKLGISRKNIERIRLRAFAKLRASLQKHV